MIDIAGRRYNSLTAVSLDHVNRHAFWLFRCDCGTEKVINGNLVRRGTTKSCGCKRSQLIGSATRRHGMSHTPTHKSWLAMLNRATCPNATGHERYFDAGIGVCDRWRTFENFLADMGERPAGTSLDRIDNAAGYEPSNCRWATNTTQSHNRRVTRWLEHDGQKWPIAHWARIVGLCEGTLRDRIKHGWPVARALTEPARRRA